MGAQLAELVDGVDAVLTEGFLAGGEHGPDLGDGACGAFTVDTSGDAAHMRKTGQDGQAATNEIETIKGDVGWGVGQGE